MATLGENGRSKVSDGERIGADGEQIGADGKWMIRLMTLQNIPHGRVTEPASAQDFIKRQDEIDPYFDTKVTFK